MTHAELVDRFTAEINLLVAHICGGKADPQDDNPERNT